MPAKPGDRKGMCEVKGDAAPAKGKPQLFVHCRVCLNDHVVSARAWQLGKWDKGCNDCRIDAISRHKNPQRLVEMWVRGLSYAEIAAEDGLDERYAGQRTRRAATPQSVADVIEVLTFAELRRALLIALARHRLGQWDARGIGRALARLCPRSAPVQPKSHQS